METGSHVDTTTDTAIRPSAQFGSNMTMAQLRHLYDSHWVRLHHSIYTVKIIIHSSVNILVNKMRVRVILLVLALCSKYAVRGVFDESRTKMIQMIHQWIAQRRLTSGKGSLAGRWHIHRFQTGHMSKPREL